MALEVSTVPVGGFPPVTHSLEWEPREVLALGKDINILLCMCLRLSLLSLLTTESLTRRALGLPDALSLLQLSLILTPGLYFSFLPAQLHIANDVYCILCSIPRHFILGGKYYY